MAILRKHGTELDHPVRGRLLVGRSPLSGLRLEALGVSSEHASIQWTGAQWTIRDLGSRNGTKVNERLLLRTSYRLVPGDEIVFGDPREQWAWVDGTAPPPVALTVEGREVEGSAGMLLLPTEHEPVAAVLARGERWQLEMAGSVCDVADQQWVEVEGVRYRLLLPALDPSMERTQTVVPGPLLVQAQIRFRVSLDEEHVQVTLETHQGAREISQRAFHYMLLVLARQRQEDQALSIPEGDSGWMYADELARKLGIEINALNQHVHRARRAAGPVKGKPESELSFSDAHELIQRRGGQIRLGVADIVIERGVHATP